MSVFKIKQMCQLPSTIWSLISVQTTELPRGSRLVFEGHRPPSPHLEVPPLTIDIYWIPFLCKTAQRVKAGDTLRSRPTSWDALNSINIISILYQSPPLKIHWRERTLVNKVWSLIQNSCEGNEVNLWLAAISRSTTKDQQGGWRASRGTKSLLKREKNKTYVLLLACYMVINTTVPLRFHVFWAKLKKVVALEATINRTINHFISSLNRPSFHLVLLLLYFKKMTCNHAQQEKKDLDSPRMHLSSGLVETLRSWSCWCHNVL